MKKRYVSLTLVIILTVFFSYFLVTKTRLKLIMETIKADGQATRYGVDVINFDAQIGIKECDSTNPSANGNVILKYTDKPYPNPDPNANPPKVNPSPGLPSLYATKDNGNNWKDLFSGSSQQIIGFNYNIGRNENLPGNKKSWSGNFTLPSGTWFVKVDAYIHHAEFYPVILTVDSSTLETTKNLGDPEGTSYVVLFGSIILQEGSHTVNLQTTRTFHAYPRIIVTAYSCDGSSSSVKYYNTY